MAIYTTTIKSMVDNNFDFNLKEYPIFNENYRATLNNKIINHYLYREIAFETVALFKHFLNVKMNEIMPLYNKFYQSELLTFSPLYDENIETYSNKKYKKEVDEKTVNEMLKDILQNDKLTGNENTVETNVENLKNVYSDTPQGLLSIGSIDNEIYATNVDINKNNVNNNKNNTLNSTTTKNENTKANANNDKTVNENIEESEQFTSKGNRQSQSTLLKEFRSTFINIDMMIIDELQDLFFNLY